MPGSSIDNQLRETLEHGVSQSFLEYCADLLHDSGIDIARTPHARLYLQYLYHVIEILLSDEKDRTRALVSELTILIPEDADQKTLEQRVRKTIASIGDKSLETVSLVIGLFAYHKADNSGDPDEFFHLFIVWWISFHLGEQ